MNEQVMKIFTIIIYVIGCLFCTPTIAGVCDEYYNRSASYVRQHGGHQFFEDTIVQCAKSGDSMAAYMLYLYYSEGIFGFKKDKKKSSYWIRQASLVGNTLARDIVISNYIKRKKYDDALYWVKKSIGKNWKAICSQYKFKKSDFGDNTLYLKPSYSYCFDMAIINLKIIDLEFLNYLKNKKNRKVNELIEYAQIGSYHAQYNLAYMLASGKANKRHYKLAIDLFTQAQNNLISSFTSEERHIIQYSLLLSYKGLGLDKEAFKYVYMLAKQHEIAPMLDLVLGYYKGDNMPQNRVKSYAWAIVLKSITDGSNEYKKINKTVSILLKMMRSELAPGELEIGQEYAYQLGGEKIN